jgi:integrase
MNTVISLANYIREKYVAFMLSKGLKTTYELLKMIDVVLGYSLAEKPLNAITQSDVERFMRELMQSRNISNARVNRYRSLLSTIFYFAISEDDLFRNPLQTIKKSKEFYRSRYLETDEIQALLKACRMSRNKELYDIVVLALNTGMRRNEILTLQVGDVNLNLKKSELVLRGQITKNGDSRKVPLNSDAVEVIRPYLQSEGKLFKSKDIRSAFENALKRASIEAWFHDLRRTFATHLLQKKTPIYIISSLLGHKDIKTTERYLAIRDDLLHENVARISFK